MNSLRRTIRIIATAAAIICVLSNASAADNLRALWIQRADTQEQLQLFLDLARQSDQKIDVEVREAKGLSELILAVKSTRPDLILGLTLSQVQFLANGGFLFAIGSRDIETRFSRSLYVSPSNRNATNTPDQIIAAPINVTLAAVCFDRKNPRVSAINENSRFSLEDIATGRGIERVSFPDPRYDPVGRAVLLAAFQTSSLHSGWSLIELLDVKVDSYTRNYSRDCSEVDTTSKANSVDVSFTTFEVAREQTRRNPTLNFLLLRDPILVPNFFAAVGRERSSPDSIVNSAFGRLTNGLLERQLQLGTLPDFSSLRGSLYEGKGTYFYKSSGQIVDEWAARYDSKSRQGAFVNPFNE